MMGNLSAEMLASLLETIPLEFSIVDKDDKVVAWNKHTTRTFRRPPGTIGKDVRNCHPKKSLDLVEKILAEMKAGTRDRAQFWIDLHMEGHERPQKILIEYYALRDGQGNYLGCLEATQNITEIQELKGQKRLLDE